MKDIITITLTDQDCRGAWFTSIHDCPIARAFKKKGYALTHGVGVLGVDTSTGTFRPVISEKDIKDIGSLGRMSGDFIKPLIQKANAGETFRKRIRFYKV